MSPSGSRVFSCFFPLSCILRGIRLDLQTRNKVSFTNDLFSFSLRSVTEDPREIKHGSCLLVDNDIPDEIKAQINLKLIVVSYV